MKYKETENIEKICEYFPNMIYKKIIWVLEEIYK